MSTVSGELLFATWAPEGALWSRWAKPVLFATLRPEDLAPAPGPTPAQAPLALDAGFAPPPAARTAIVVDLPGAESARMGMALGRRGYRPVPLYNACPGGPSPAVDLAPIVAELVGGAGELPQLAIAPDAPPAFLLDADRLRKIAEPVQGKFDNRWMVFPQDFPSGNLLRANGIDRALLLQRGNGSGVARDDLRHVLLRWQEAGVAILLEDPFADREPRAIAVTRPSRFKSVWYRVLALAGFYRNAAGGFGSLIPLPGAGGLG